jgi:hypothetical protein
VDTLREKAAQTIVLFGQLTCLLMDPFARSDFEASLDSAQRLPFPISTSAYVVGQQIAGLQTQGGVVWFHTDNTLSAMHSAPQYDTDLVEGAPATTPTVSVSAGALGGSRTSKWYAADAGNVYYVVTEMVNEREGLGTRAPSGATYEAVAAGEEVTLTLTPGNPLADSFKVYRGTDDDDAITEAWFIFEVANDGAGSAVTAYDGNLYRPNTTHAFGLNIKSDSQRALSSGLVNAYETAREKSEQFLNQPDRPGNTVATAELGPSMGIMALASILAEVDRPLMYSACSPEVRNPLQNVYFYNIGRA